MSATKWFDTEAELQKLRSPPAKVANPAKVDEEETENFSRFSRFSRGACTEMQISSPHTPLSPTAFSEDEAASFHDDAREADPAVVAWPCPHCSHPATIDDVFPSLDGERTLTLWRCDPCQVVAVTPDAIRQPPTVWVKNTEQ